MYKAMERGLAFKTIEGNIITLRPALTITREEMDQVVDILDETIGEVENASENLIEIYKDQLKTRIESLTKGIVELDPQRIAQEAAILADRSDITEEIVRIRSHLNQFQSFIDSTEPAGRKLNFLIQELNREFNTIGSKTGKASVSHLIVNMKSELEKLREQVQNVE